MRYLFVATVAALAGCGSHPQIFTVANNQLAVHDQLYLSKPAGYFCNALAANQVDIQLLDFSPACYLDQNGTNPYDQSNGHTRLDIILAIGLHSNDLRNPYTVSKVDCNLGPGDNGTAWFYHFPPGDPTTVMPDQQVQVDSGTVKIDQYDASNTKAIKGHFDLTFGGQQLSGTLDALNCDKQ